MNKQKQKYNIWTIGCQMNTADSRHLANCLEGFGYEFTDNADEANLVVLNTCVVRASAENKVNGKLQYMQGLKKHRPEIKIALMGCFVGRGKNTALREQFPFVDIFLPPSDISPIIEHLDEFAPPREQQEEPPLSCTSKMNDSGHLALPASAGNAVSANVPAVLGCSHACTYCIIPYRRGREHSRPRTEILKEVRSLTLQGVKEIILLGQIVDRYGADSDSEYDLADLLRDTAAIDGVERVRFLTSHPGYMTDRIISAIAEEEKICPHFELPCQSGSDKILTQMRRGYTADEFSRLVSNIRRRIPSAAINTDIIVGFPGETDAHFIESYRLAEELRFDTIHIAKYSPRPQTYAARHLPDNVPEEEKERRRKMLDNLQNTILTENNALLLGKTVDVLVDGKTRKNQRWRGRTPQNKIVFFEDSSNQLGQIVSVKIKWTGPFSMIGNKI